MTCHLQYVEYLNVVHKMCGQPPILRLSPQRWLRVCLWVVPLWLDHPVKESNALHQWRNYNFWAPWQHSLITAVLIHNLGHFGPPLLFWASRHCRGCRWLGTPLHYIEKTMQLRTPFSQNHWTQTCWPVQWVCCHSSSVPWRVVSSPWQWRHAADTSPQCAVDATSREAPPGSLTVVVDQPHADPPSDPRQS